MYIRLDFNNSDYILLFKQDIPAHRHRIIRAYHVELLQKISDSSFPVWPPEEIAEDVYKHFNLYIRKLFSVLNLKIDPDDLTLPVVTIFAFAPEPVGDSETYRPGLSLLEQLMGFSLKEVPPPDPNAPEYPTTGDEVLDVKVDLFLIFKRHAPKLWESHSLEELALMSRQANERMRDPNQESDKDWIDFKEAMEELPELFVQSKEAVLLKLEQLNICIPMPSNLSPYAELCADFFTTLNTRFVELFQLKTFYSEDNILPGERYGVITLNSIEPDRDRSYGSEVRGGHQLLSMRMDLILKSGINTRVEGEAEKARLMLDLHHGIPKLKEYYDNDELVAEIRSDESFLGILAQAKRPQGNVANSPNSWIATVTCSATALILIKVDINGLHLMR